MLDCCIGTHMPWWFAVSIPPSPTSGISPNVIPFQPPHPCCPSLSPQLPNRPQCVTFPSLCPCVLIVQHLPMNENMHCLVFCSCVNCWQWWFSDSSMSLQRTLTHPFHGCIVFHGVYVPHFLYPVYHWWAFGLVPSLYYCEHNKNTCVCVFIIEWFIILYCWYYQIAGIAVSNFISSSRFLKNCHTVFHNGLINLHSHQQYKSVHISPYPL